MTWIFVPGTSQLTPFALSVVAAVVTALILVALIVVRIVIDGIAQRVLWPDGEPERDPYLEAQADLQRRRQR